MTRARECMASGRPQREINRCLVEALRTSASTETELRLLCVTYRSMGDRANGTSCMQRIRERLRRQQLEPSQGD